jgi:hypothetical protein
LDKVVNKKAVNQNRAWSKTIRPYFDFFITIYAKWRWLRIDGLENAWVYASCLDVKDSFRIGAASSI